MEFFILNGLIHGDQLIKRYLVLLCNLRERVTRYHLINLFLFLILGHLVDSLLKRRQFLIQQIGLHHLHRIAEIQLQKPQLIIGKLFLRSWLNIREISSSTALIPELVIVSSASCASSFCSFAE